MTLAISCGNDEPSPVNSNDLPKKIEKSPKRGLSFNLTNTEDFETLKEGVSWWYN